MTAAIPALTEMPSPQYVMSADGRRIATYVWGDEDAPTVMCVHGFASSCRDNWVNTGWVRDLTRAGFRVLGVDQRGHGGSDKPHEATAFGMDALVNDLVTVLDTYLLDTVHYAGYSLGARVGWQLAVQMPHHIDRAVLGGIPDGRPLARLQIEQARAYADHGTPVEDPVTRNYVTLAERVAATTCVPSSRSPRACAGATPTPTRLGRRCSRCCSPREVRMRSSSGRRGSRMPRRPARSSSCPAGTTSTRPGRGYSGTWRSSSSPSAAEVDRWAPSS